VLYNVDPAWAPCEKSAALDGAEMLKAELSREGHPVVNVPILDDGVARALQSFDPGKHVVFNWCEELPGKPRSDAAVAEILEQLHFAYTGSPPDVLACSWDKAATKALLNRSGIPTPVWRVFREAKDADQWGRFPAIVKPAFEHCSLGITSDAVVTDPQALRSRLAFVLETFDQPVIVEDFVDGREFHVTIWGNGLVRALPAAEMNFNALEDMRDRLCTFDSKFTPGSLHYEKIELLVPAPLDEAQMTCLNRTAMDAYRVTRCRDYARIDVRLGDGVYYVLDINPNADFSPDTSMVVAAEAAGLSYGVLASFMVNLAAQRHPAFFNPELDVLS